MITARVQSHSVMLRAQLDEMPRLALVQYPSPVRYIRPQPGLRLWVKDDAGISSVYGGNKARKLEYLLADARRHKATRLVASGDVNSHTLLACALHGLRAGFHITLVTMPTPSGQPSTIAWDRLTHAGARWVRATGFLTAMAHARIRAIAGAYYVPLGGSTPAAVLGYMRAVYELADQVAQGIIPEPDSIYVTLGTGGTVAGILLGLAATGLHTHVIAVQTVEAFIANRRRIAGLVRAAARLLDAAPALAVESMQHLQHIDAAWLGRGYSFATPASLAAVACLHNCGITLDTSFSGKTMAALLHDCTQPDARTILFWNTYAPIPIPYRVNAELG